MKRFVALALSMLLALSLLCACGKRGEEPFSPENAVEEYARIYPNGQAFDFSTVTAFTRKSTLTLTTDALSSAADLHGQAYAPTTEQMEYKYENTDDAIRSQRTMRLINMNNPFIEAPNSTADAPKYRPQYAPYSREIYDGEVLVYADMDGEGNQKDTAVTPQKVYETREEYLLDEEHDFDTPAQRVVPYALSLFSSFTGKLEGSTYRMTGIVDAAVGGEAFFEAFMANYSFKSWYTALGAGERMYEYFINPTMFSDATFIKVEIVSDRSGLCSVTETLRTTAASRPILAVGGATVTLTCTTSFSTDAFTEAIVMPQLKTA